MSWYKFFRFFGFIFYKVFYRVKYINKENAIENGKSIVVCNHLGKADVLVVGAMFKDKTMFLSKKEWFDNKFLAWLLNKMGAIPIDRDKPSITSIKKCLEVLKNDKRLCVFPEGRRNFEDNKLQEIKQGTALFAVKGRALITPVIIYDHLKMFKKNYVIIGKPIDLSNYYDKKFDDEVSKSCTQIIANEMQKLQQELFKIVEDIKNKKSKDKDKF